MNYLKNIGLIIVMFGATLFTSCSNSQTAENTAQTSKEKQEQKIDFENAYIVDVRTPKEFAAGHYEGAINIPISEVEEHFEKFKGHDQIVVYCRSGARSGKAKDILENEGFTDVINAINQSTLEERKKRQEK